MRMLSLFTGSGIGDYAAQCAGIEVVGQVDNDPCCLYCLEKLWPDTEKFTDVRIVSIESIRKLLPIDIICGGFPCQDLSTAGRGEGIEGARSGLWREMFRIVRQIRPAWVLIENVPAIRLRGIDRIIAPVERIGYTCWPLVVGANAIGAPHRRRRFWIVANRVCDGLTDEVQHEKGRGYRDREAITYQQARSQRRKRQLAGLGFGEDVAFPARFDEPFGACERSCLVSKCSMGNGYDGVATGVPGSINRSLLRMAGNAWVPQIPYLIFQWLVTQHERGA